MKEAGEGINLFDKGVYESGKLKGMPKDKRLRLLVYIGILLPFIFLGFVALIWTFYYGTFDTIYFAIIGSIFCISSFILVAFPLFKSIPLDDQKILGLKRDRVSFSIGAMLLLVSIPIMVINSLLYLFISITGALFLFIPLFMVIPRMQKKT